MARWPLRALAALMLWLLSTEGTRAASLTSVLRWLPLSSRQTTTACNNSPLLCDRAYSNITHMGAHNSAFVRDASTGNSISGNQYYNATVALSAGIRLLQAQVHVENGALRLCHTSCSLLDVGPLEDWLAKISTWLEAHPNEVVTLLLVNSDNADVTTFGTSFNRSGISKYGFTPSSSSSSNKWPTLRALISSNTRLITFIASITPSPTYPFLLSEFSHVFETPFNTTSLSSFTCALDRPSTYASASAALSAGMLPLLNHFAYTAITPDILIPDASDIDTTNSASTSTTGALAKHADQCAAEWGGVRPTFVLVDFFDKGAVMEAADRLNGVEGQVVGRERPGGGAGRGSSGASPIRTLKCGQEKVMALVGILGWALAVL